MFACVNLLNRCACRLQPLSRAADLSAKLLSQLPIKSYQGPLLWLVNDLLHHLIAYGELDFLAGRCCRIALREPSLQWDFTLENNRFRIHPCGVADVTITATVPAVMKLLSQSADPDTLFFQRQLVIAGDVELGLLIKNRLDALEHEELPIIWQHLFAVLSVLLRLETDCQ